MKFALLAIKFFTLSLGLTRHQIVAWSRAHLTAPSPTNLVAAASPPANHFLNFQSCSFRSDLLHIVWPSDRYQLLTRPVPNGRFLSYRDCCSFFLLLPTYWLLVPCSLVKKSPEASRRYSSSLATNQRNDTVWNGLCCSTIYTEPSPRHAATGMMGMEK